MTAAAIVEDDARARLRIFLVIALSQIVSIAGSSMASFALGLWIYLRTGSVTQYGLVAVVILLPYIVALPVAGSFVDRYDRRLVLAITEAGAGVCSLALALLYWLGWLTIWSAMPWIALASVFTAFQVSSLTAIVTVLVPHEHRARANGLIQFGAAVSEIGAPVMAAALIARVTLAGVLVVDVASFACAAVTLAMVRVPAPPRSEEGARAPTSLLPGMRYAFEYIRKRPGLLGLMCLFAVVNFNMGAVNVLIAPLVLSFADASTLGRVSSSAGLGLLFGSVTMMVWGGPRRPVYAVLGAIFLQGCLLVVAPFHISAAVVAAGAFGVLFTSPIVTAASQSIWQRAVPADVQGRVFSLRATVGRGTPVLASLVAGPLADRVFEPSMAEGGFASPFFGPHLGVGRGHGIALMMVVLGVATASTAVAGFFSAGIRRVGDEPRAPIGAEPAIEAQTSLDRSRRDPRRSHESRR